jgi:hypothetical protein
MEHRIVSPQDRKVRGLMPHIEAEAVAEIGDRFAYFADGQCRNRPMEAGDNS